MQASAPHPLILLPLARVSVHFQSITEHFSPYDTIFSFTSAKGLNDVALSSACSLHTASASIKSSSDSLRQRGLSGIAEDATEHQSGEAAVELTIEDEADLVCKPDRQTRPERTDSLPNPQMTTSQPTTEQRRSLSPTKRVRNTDKALPPTPGECVEDKATTRNALEDTFLDSRPSIEGRPSVQSTRPSIRSTHTSYEYRTKVKLGPRPSMESSSAFHSQDRSGDMRPVSTLPTGVRLAAKKQASTRPKSANGRPVALETSELPLTSQKSTPPVLPEKGLAHLPTALPKQLQPIESKASAMTPEKRKLKKALELRQRQLAAKKIQQTSEKEEHSQDQCGQPRSELVKRESLTATLPDVSSADDTSADVLHERIDALNRNPDLVHVGPQNGGKEVPESFEILPISIPEASDGPSTQASSINDVDETPTDVDPTVGAEAITDSQVDVPIPDQPNPSDKTRPGLNEPRASERGSTAEILHKGDCKAGPPRILPSSDQPGDKGEETSTLQASHSPSIAPGTEKSNHEAPAEMPSRSDPTSPIPTLDSESMNVDTEIIRPREIPLPLVDEDEEINLRPRDTFSNRRSASNLRVENAEGLLPDPSLSQEENERPKNFGTSSEGVANERHERRARRHGLINPIKRVSSPDYSDEQFLSDDSFMEELKCATVQEAKPVSVSKSPMMPVFPRSVSDSKSPEETKPRSASSRLNRPKRQDDQLMMPKLPDLYSARSSSAPYAPLLEAQLSPPTLKKVGVSSGISQRIKLLEQLSSRPASPSSQHASPSIGSGSSPSSANPRKTSFHASQAAAEIARSSTQTAKNRAQMPYSAQSRSPDRSSANLKDSLVRIDVATKPGKARPESISVTARIIRGSQSKMSDVPGDGSRPRTGDLYPSPLTVEHQPMRPTSPPLSPLKPPKPRYARSLSSTSTTQKSDPPRRDSISSRLSSTPSRRGSEPEIPQSFSDLSINSMTTLDGPKDEKKESRKSRLFKRMSSISAASRRSIASALSPVRKDIKEEPIVEHSEPSRETIKPLAVEIGDVNIQFPDTLLWKRRHMKIDAQGLLVLAASKSDSVSTLRTP